MTKQTCETDPERKDARMWLNKMCMFELHTLRGNYLEDGLPVDIS